jgi:signal transduction histidine kinase
MPLAARSLTQAPGDQRPVRTTVLGRWLMVMFITWITGVFPLNALAAETSAPRADRHVVEIKQIRLADPEEPSVQTRYTLPERIFRNPRDFGRYKMTAEFTVADMSVAPHWSVYFMAMNDGGVVKVNGTTIGDVQTSSRETAVRHIRPFAFLIPDGVLRNGTNTLELELGSTDNYMYLARVFVGPAEVVRDDFERRLFWQNTMAQVGFDFSLVLSAVLFGIFSLRRSEIKYLLLGTTAFSWSLVCIAYFLPPLPTALFPMWCLVRIVGIALVTNCTWVFLLLEARPDNKWFPRLCALVGLAGPVQYMINFLLNNEIYSPLFESAWGFVTVGLGFYPLSALAQNLYRRWEWRSAVFLVATTAGLGAGLADMVLSNTNNSVFDGLGYTAQAVSPLWFAGIGFLLVREFVSSINEQDNLNRLMSVKLKQQQVQLTNLHERSRQREREATIHEERQRIMQDIHDGLGSQLVSSLALSERGNLSGTQISQVLMECIEDLRLAIDSMSGDDDNFCILMGNLRFRMEPRLRAAGITLRWDVSGLHDDVMVPVSKALALLRILQEVITNTLKHARASQLCVMMSSNEGSLVIRIQDNGIGFDPRVIRSGKGLPGLKKRAEQIGAQLVLDSSKGTLIQISLPV